MYHLKWGLILSVILTVGTFLGAFIMSKLTSSPILLEMGIFICFTFTAIIDYFVVEKFV